METGRTVVVFGKKSKLEEGTNIFSVKQNGDYKDFILGTITGVDGRKVGVNGIIVNPVGLKNKIAQGKTGQRSLEILQNPTPDNIVLALIYRVEHESFNEILDLDHDKCDIIPPRTYLMMDGWVREFLPELVNKVLSLPPGPEQDEAKRILRHRMDTLTDKHLKRTLYSVCRSLKILN